MIWFLIILIASIFLFYCIFKPYFVVTDTYTLFTGGNGSGKSYFSVVKAVKLLRRQRLKVFFHNLFHRDKIAKPLLYSSIPLRISRKEWARRLLPEHLLENGALPEKCVIFIDEMATFLNQMQVRYVNLDSLEDFFTFVRHYLKGPYVVLNTQNVNKVIYVLRYCINESLNLSGFKKYFHLPILCRTSCKHVSLSEDIKTIVSGNYEDDITYLYSFMPFHKKRYDTYCYSERYKYVPLLSTDEYSSYKVDKVFRAPKDKIKSFILN